MLLLVLRYVVFAFHLCEWLDYWPYYKNCLEALMIKQYLDSVNELDTIIAVFILCFLIFC